MHAEVEQSTYDPSVGRDVDAAGRDGEGAPPRGTPTGGLEARVDALDADQARRDAADRLDRRFELSEAILLSLAAILAAWAGFQAAKWSGQQADAYSRASAARVEATRASTRSGQQTVVDVNLFTDWLAALDDEGILDATLDQGSAYQPNSAELSGFLYERFRDEFKPAVATWLDTDPGNDPNAPESPFDLPEYRLASTAESQDLDNKADTAVAEARDDNQIADQYVLVTIMFATVLFFAGISSKLDTARARMFLLGTGATLFVVTTGVLLSFPKNF